MKWRTLLLYAAIALGVLIFARIAVSIAVGILGLVWAIVTTLVALLIAGGLLYGGYRLLLWFIGSDSSPISEPEDTTQPAPTERKSGVDEIKQRYTSGELTEKEFERRLKLELDGPETDEIDREYRRERE